MSKNFLTPIKLPSIPSDPNSARKGDLYFNSTKNKIKYNDGSNWGIVGDQSSPNTLYVSKSGNDNNDGKDPSRAFLTIKKAMSVASSGTTVKVSSGNYLEENPVTIPANVALVGDSLRNVKISGSTANADIFYVNNGVYITEVTFKNHVAPAAAIAFNPNGSAGVITTSPYVYNCSSTTTTGTGMRIDGSVVGGGKSMVSGDFTQVNQGGIGIHIINQGYAQLVAIYTIGCDKGIWCESGGFCSLLSSDSSFGNYGLVADGVSDLLYTGTTTSMSKYQTTITINGLSQTPYINNVVTFDNGSTFYTIESATHVSSGSSTITLVEGLQSDYNSGITAKFYQKSLILASGHTFEYVGSGTNLATALPQVGGQPIEANEVVTSGGGNVYASSTDQKGNFKIGGDLVINGTLGTIAGVTFDRSLFAVMTPYILALEG
jgi:hypothetical protein